MAIKDNKKKSSAKSIAFLILPYLSAIIAAILVAVFLFTYVTSMSIVQLAVNKAQKTDNTTEHLASQIIKDASDEQFAKIKYESQWATVNVEGWENKNIPVYLGNTNYILTYGAGTPMYSKFCGQGGRVIMDAHVTTYFNEIEKTEVGAKVYVNTVYGNYVYKVDKLQIFDQYDSTYINPSYDSEQLVMYTCYPYDNNYRPRVQRIALICTMVEGKVW
ncbi:MAG: sortase [Acutalibacteraceae bacterium]|nr:sortase [Acutalibacteraceae bacterium]